jgi:hypothetical protein
MGISSSSSYTEELNYLSFCKNSYLKTTLVITNLKKEGRRRRS